MPEPVSTTAVANLSFLAAGASGTAVTLFGISTGMDATMTLVGFIGSCCAMVLLNTVPASDDTWRDLLRVTWRRMFVGMASACTAAYITPVLLERAAEPSLATICGAAFIVGGSAQYILAAITRKFSKDYIGADIPPIEGPKSRNQDDGGGQT